jgi:hypothetical protein
MNLNIRDAFVCIVRWGLLHSLEERKRVEYAQQCCPPPDVQYFYLCSRVLNRIFGGKRDVHLSTVQWPLHGYLNTKNLSIYPIHSCFSFLVISFVLLECCAESGCWSRQLLLRLLFFHMPLRNDFHHQQQSGSLILQCGTPSLPFVITVTVSSLDQRNLLLPITGTTCWPSPIQFAVHDSSVCILKK